MLRPQNSTRPAGLVCNLAGAAVLSLLTAGQRSVEGGIQRLVGFGWVGLPSVEGGLRGGFQGPLGVILSQNGIVDHATDFQSRCQMRCLHVQQIVTAISAGNPPFAVAMTHDQGSNTFRCSAA